MITKSIDLNFRKEYVSKRKKLNMKKLTPFGAMVISMVFSIICVVVVLIHIHQNLPTCK